jgi:hypothetical protein
VNTFFPYFRMAYPLFVVIGYVVTLRTVATITAHPSKGGLSDRLTSVQMDFSFILV